MFCRLRYLSILLIIICLLVLPISEVMATGVSRLSLCNLEGNPGHTTRAQILLTGTEQEIRTGYWDVYYKQTDGDTEKMDITSWITIEPKEFTISANETKDFFILVKIPGDTSPGLWGATTEQAGETGHSGERRTYIIFKDTVEGGNVYSGLLIPISVKVTGNPNPLIPIFNFLKNNMVVVILVVIIAILSTLLVIKTKHPKK